jgi:uncharacterized membrane protein
MAKKAVQKKTESSLNNKPKDNEMTVPPNTPNKMIIDDRGLAFAVYILYLLGYLTGITAFIGVIIAYLQSGSSDSAMKSHYTFQVRTFWIGLLYLFGGVLLLHLAVGALILLWWFVWSLVRNTKGLLALNRNEAIANPESWMFGD